MQLSKVDIVKKFIIKVESELAGLKKSLEFTKQGVTHSDSKQESKYDTRGLEASYLAGGQERRVAQVQEVLNYLNFLLSNWSKKEVAYEMVLPGALVEVEKQGETFWFFYSEVGGGLSIDAEGCEIKILGPDSPLGRELFRMEEGDSIELELPSGVREYDILSIS